MNASKNEAQMMRRAAKQSDQVRGWTGGGASAKAARRLFNLCRVDAGAKALCQAAIRSQTRR